MSTTPTTRTHQPWCEVSVHEREIALDEVEADECVRRHESWCDQAVHDSAERTLGETVGCESETTKVGRVDVYAVVDPLAGPRVVIDPPPSGDQLTADQARQLGARLFELAFLIDGGTARTARVQRSAS